MMNEFDPYSDGTNPMFRQVDASKLTREEIARIMNWCDHQAEDLWDGMTLQDILNVWHISRDWDTFEDWAMEEGDIARKAWNSVVQDHKQHLSLHETAAD
jgi:hypothetical protein